jgi:hypothetical protein
MLASNLLPAMHAQLKFWPSLFLALAVIASCTNSESAPHRPVFSAPLSDSALHIAIPVPAGAGLDSAGRWMLVEEGGGDRITVDLAPAIATDGRPLPDQQVLLASVPPRADATKARRFLLEEAASVAHEPDRFAFEEMEGPHGKGLGLRHRGRQVFVYNHGTQSKAGVPAHRNRSTYIHPLFGFHGEVLTDDFPKDHYHHRGLFWAWPHVIIDGKQHSLWDLRGIEQRFERWLCRQPGAAAAVLGVENGWYIGEKKVVQERVWLRTYPAFDGGQAIDIDLILTPIGQAVALAGAEAKSYGGLTLRFGPRQQTVITTPLGDSPEDLAMTRLPWADLSAQFANAPEPSGAAIFISPDHPDYPPTWLTRHYGVLCVGWPGVQAASFQPGEAIRASYRVWIHRGRGDAEKVQRAYRAYQLSQEVRW